MTTSMRSLDELNKLGLARETLTHRESRQRARVYARFGWGSEDLVVKCHVTLKEAQEFVKEAEMMREVNGLPKSARVWMAGMEVPNGFVWLEHPAGAPIGIICKRGDQ